MSLLHDTLSNEDIDRMFAARSSRTLGEAVAGVQIERRHTIRRAADRRTMDLIAECRRRGVNVDG